MSGFIKDEATLNKIKSGDQVFLRARYMDYRAPFVAFVLKYFKCSEENALEVYQEAFTIFYYNIKDGKLSPPLKSALKTYLFGVGKKVYQKRFQGTYQNRMIFPEKWKDEIEGASVLDQYELEEQTRIVRALFKRLGDRCRELLQLMYFDNYEASEVVGVMDFNTTGAVRKHKFDCLKKLRILFRNSQAGKH